MHDAETIDRGMFDEWRAAGWLQFAQFLKPKRIKFFLVNPRGEYRVRHLGKIVYQGRDLDEAVKIYNSI